MSNKRNYDTNAEEPKMASEKRRKDEDSKAASGSAQPPDQHSRSLSESPSTSVKRRFTPETCNQMQLYYLGNNRAVGVNIFRDEVYIAIREYFDNDGEWLPTRKGINLTVEQWYMLTESMANIDEEIHSAGGDHRRYTVKRTDGGKLMYRGHDY